MLIHGHTEECIRKYGAAEQRREEIIESVIPTTVRLVKALV